jgi:hypothetical protein
LRITPCDRPRRTRSSAATTSATDGPSSRWKRERTAAGRSAGSSASSAADGAGEARRRLHDHVDHEGAAAQPHLRALPVELVDGLPHLADRAFADSAATVQRAVHGGLAETGLDGYLANPERVPHPYTMRGF